MLIYFTNQVDPSHVSGQVHFDGQQYAPVEFASEGFAWGGEGTIPRPTIKVSNAVTFMSSALALFGDLLGAELTRTRTFVSYLDGWPDEDGQAWLSRDVFLVEQKTRESPIEIEWRLRAKLDRNWVKLPERRILRDTCTHRYREWTGSAFDYTKATCPYTGGDSFDYLNDTATDPNDICSKNLQGCKVRFPAAPLPTLAFPGIGSI
jgi:lambda family phage minor tail protein L